MNNMYTRENKIKVYYDGLCKLCSAEINHYRKQEGAQKILFIDICAEDFDANAEGIDPYLVHKIMHVRRLDGNLATRVDAFIEIWMHLPKYRIAAKVARKPLVKMGLEVGYSCFAFIRPLLPRHSKLKDCQDSPYCEVKNAKTTT